MIERCEECGHIYWWRSVLYWDFEWRGWAVAVSWPHWRWLRWRSNYLGFYRGWNRFSWGSYGPVAVTHWYTVEDSK